MLRCREVAIPTNVDRQTDLQGRIPIEGLRQRSKYLCSARRITNVDSNGVYNPTCYSDLELTLRKGPTMAERLI